jgi:hypothetical protein
VAAAGQPPSRRFLDDLKQAGASLQSAQDVAKFVVDDFLRQWREMVERVVLFRYAMMDYPGFLDACKQKSLSQEMIRDIWSSIKEVQLDLSHLVAARGESGVELYGVNDPGGSLSLDSPGFGAIGSGARLAMASLYRNPQIKNAPLPKAVYAVYEAKKAAEAHFQVGRATDIAVLAVGHDACFLGKSVIDGLEQLYQSRQPPALTDAEVATIRDLLPKLD